MKTQTENPHGIPKGKQNSNACLNRKLPVEDSILVGDSNPEHLNDTLRFMRLARFIARKMRESNGRNHFNSNHAREIRPYPTEKFKNICASYSRRFTSFESGRAAQKNTFSVRFIVKFPKPLTPSQAWTIVPPIRCSETVSVPV
jgi:hypothetical protein